MLKLCQVRRGVQPRQCDSWATGNTGETRPEYRATGPPTTLSSQVTLGEYVVGTNREDSLPFPPGMYRPGQGGLPAELPTVDAEELRRAECAVCKVRNLKDDKNGFPMNYSLLGECW